MHALTLLVAAAAALSLPVPAVGAEAPATPAVGWSLCWPAPTPGTGWDLVSSGYDTCAQCEAVGAAGVSDGDWTTYRCGTFPVGLDVIYNLYVPSPAP